MLIEFAERFAQLRQGLGYTQQEIAKKLGVTPQAVSKWENGNSLPDVETIRSIAQLLDCSSDYLLGNDISVSSEHNLESLKIQRQTEVENAILKKVLFLEVGRGLVDMLLEEEATTYAPIQNMRIRLADHMGIMFPMINLRDNIPALGDKEYRILLHDREVLAQGTSEYPKYFYVRKDSLPVSDWHVIRPEGEWMEKQAVTPAGYVEYSAFNCITAHLEEMILQHYDRILNRQLTADMVNMVRKRYPAAVEGVVPEQVSLARLQRVLAKLVTSGVPVNRLDYIIGYLEEHPEPEHSFESVIAALSQELQ